MVTQGGTDVALSALMTVSSSIVRMEGAAVAARCSVHPVSTLSNSDNVTELQHVIIKTMMTIQQYAASSCQLANADSYKTLPQGVGLGQTDSSDAAKLSNH